MTAAGRLGRLAALLLLPALARGWDWSTNVESTFDCETHRNPIQLYKEELFKCKGGGADNGKECDSDADCTGGKCKKELNGDGSPDARGDVRPHACDEGAVLRADDGHLCAIGRADGHGGALAFGSADGRADEGADAADSLDGRDDDIRARRRRGTPPPHPSPRITPLTITQGPSY